MDSEQGFDRIYGFLDFLCPLHVAVQASEQKVLRGQTNNKGFK